MKYELKMKIGNHDLIVSNEVPGVKEMIEDTSLLFEMPKACGNPKCKSSNIGMRFHASKTYKFYALMCADCGHEMQFGQFKEGNKLFPKHYWAPRGAATQREEQDQRDQPPGPTPGRVPVPF